MEAFDEEGRQLCQGGIDYIGDDKYLSRLSSKAACASAPVKIDCKSEDGAKTYLTVYYCGVSKNGASSSKGTLSVLVKAPPE